MRTKLILSAVALLMACKMFAVQLTPEEALARMNTTNSQSKGFATDKSSLQLTYTSTFKGNNTYYVFNKGNENGFLILSADDCMPAVLGVVEGNSFDYDKLPDNMKWWLSQYDVSISSYSAKGKKYVSSSKAKKAKKDIEPLLGDIQWNQWAPYNMLCPTVENKETPTGCVATAMVQVMGMYQWPKRGYVKNEYQMFAPSYDEEGNYVHGELTMARDFTQSKYKWEKILPQYDGYESEEENLAIAQLMYDCGISINMEYKSSGSASDLPEVVNALVKNFSYDKNIRIEYRKFYDDDVWENMLYENLSKGMPLVCSGQDGKTFFEGHAFVCDGYMVDGNLFHFNWGWGGNADGYFFLSGNGNGNGDDDEGLDEECLYNKAQNAIFNIKPSKTPYVEGSEGEFPLLVYKSCKFYVDDKTTDVIPRSIKSNAYGWDFDLVYSGYVAHEYSIGYKFKNESNEYIMPFRYQEGELLPFADVYMNFGFDYENILKNGKYTVSYVYKDITAGNTEWKDAIYQPGATKPVVEVTGLEPFCSVVGEPEVLYNGKNVIDDREIHRVPGVNEITIKFKVKALKALKNNEIIINLHSPEHDVAKTLKLSKAAANSVQDVEAKMSIKEFKANGSFGVYLLQSKDDEYIYLPDSRKYLSWVNIYDDNSTGIETITQAEEKASSETIYDIYGRKVNTTNRGGLYIKNGKKFIAK